MIETERNKELVRAFVRAINTRDWNVLEAVVAPRFLRHSDAGGKPGVTSRGDLVALLLSEIATFPDAQESIEDLVAEGNRVAARHRFKGTQKGHSGTHPPSGRTMTAEYIAIYRIEGNVIVEAWAEWDNLTGLAQLGHLEFLGSATVPKE